MHSISRSLSFSSTSPTALFLAIFLCSISVSLTGCSIFEPARLDPPVTATPHVDVQPAEVEAFGGFSFPAEVQRMEAQNYRNAYELNTYEARFVTTREEAETFCKQFGGATPAAGGLTEEVRKNFGITEDTRSAPRKCASSRPGHTIEREVFIVYPSEQETQASVYMLVYDVPNR